MAGNDSLQGSLDLLVLKILSRHPRLGLIILVVLLLGLLPALRGSAVRPVTALKGGEDSHSLACRNAHLSSQLWLPHCPPCFAR